MTHNCFGILHGITGLSTLKNDTKLEVYEKRLKKAENSQKLDIGSIIKSARGIMAGCGMKPIFTGWDTLRHPLMGNEDNVM